MKNFLHSLQIDKINKITIQFKNDSGIWLLLNDLKLLKGYNKLAPLSQTPAICNIPKFLSKNWVMLPIYQLIEDDTQKDLMWTNIIIFFSQYNQFQKQPSIFDEDYTIIKFLSNSYENKTCYIISSDNSKPINKLFCKKIINHIIENELTNSINCCL